MADRLLSLAKENAADAGRPVREASEPEKPAADPGAIRTIGRN